MTSRYSAASAGTRIAGRRSICGDGTSGDVSTTVPLKLDSARRGLKRPRTGILRTSRTGAGGSEARGKTIPTLRKERIMRFLPRKTETPPLHARTDSERSQHISVFSLLLARHPSGVSSEQGGQDIFSRAIRLAEGTVACKKRLFLSRGENGKPDLEDLQLK